LGGLDHGAPPRQIWGHRPEEQKKKTNQGALPRQEKQNKKTNLGGQYHGAPPWQEKKTKKLIRAARQSGSPGDPAPAGEKKKKKN